MEEEPEAVAEAVAEAVGEAVEAAAISSHRLLIQITFVSTS